MLQVVLQSQVSSSHVHLDELTMEEDFEPDYMYEHDQDALEDDSTQVVPHCQVSTIHCLK